MGPKEAIESVRRSWQEEREVLGIYPEPEEAYPIVLDAAEKWVNNQTEMISIGCGTYECMKCHKTFTPMEDIDLETFPIACPWCGRIDMEAYRKVREEAG